MNTAYTIELPTPTSLIMKLRLRRVRCCNLTFLDPAREKILVQQVTHNNIYSASYSPYNLFHHIYRYIGAT